MRGSGQTGTERGAAMGRLLDYSPPANGATNLSDDRRDLNHVLSVARCGSILVSACTGRGG